MDSHSEAGVLETGLIFGLKQLKIYKKEIIDKAQEPKVFMRLRHNSRC